MTCITLNGAGYFLGQKDRPKLAPPELNIQGTHMMLKLQISEYLRLHSNNWVMGS